MPAGRSFENPQESFARVSAEGVIRDAAFGPGGLADAALGPLIGRPLGDLVTSESREKVSAMLDGGAADAGWRQLGFIDGSGGEVPVAVQLFPIGAGRLLAVGRDERPNAAAQRRLLAVQHALEAEHGRLRRSDLRFHTLLDLAELAVVTLDGRTLEVLDASAAAAARLAAGGGDPVGRTLPALLDGDGAGSVRDHLLQVAAGAPAGPIVVRLRDGTEQPLQAALFRHGDAPRLLVRLPARDEEAASGRGGVAEALVARSRQGIAVTSADLRIVQANRAFVDLAQLSTEANATGQPLERFVGRNGVDTSILAATLREQSGVAGFATVLVGAYGGTTEVEIDAVRLDDGGAGQLGFFVRAIEQGRRRAELAGHARSGLVERMTDVVGRVALKDIVRDTTDAIERLCIETALETTGNNRAAAAEMLGISRQSLYSKLARYGIDGRNEDTASPV